MYAKEIKLPTNEITMQEAVSMLEEQKRKSLWTVEKERVVNIN